MKDTHHPPDPDQTTPHNIEAEQSVLGAVLVNNDTLDAIPWLEHSHFYDPVHARIFATARAMVAEGRLASPVTMKLALADDEGFKELGAGQYLVRLVDAVASIVAIKEYAGTVRDLWVRREVVAVAERLRAGACHFAPGATAAQTLDTAEAEIGELRVAASPRPMVTMFSAALHESAEKVEAAIKGGSVIGASTGFPQLDENLGGLGPSTQTLIGAATSMGKTALACCLAYNTAREAGEDGPGQACAFFSLEMPRWQVGQRIASYALARRGLRIPYRDLRRGALDDDTFLMVLRALHEIESLPIVMNDDAVRDLPKIKAAIRRAQKIMERRGTPLRVAVIDYLQQITVPGAKSKHESVMHAAMDLKAFANETGLALVTLSQVKPEVADRKDKRPLIHDIRWATEAEESADAVAFLYRHEYYLEAELRHETDPERKSELASAIEKVRDRAEINIEKNRHGEKGRVNLWCDLPVNRFEAEPPDTAIKVVRPEVWA